MLMGACTGQYGTDKSDLLRGVGKRGQRGSRESCIMLENGPTQSLVTQCSSLAVCKLNFVLQAKNAEDEATIGVCKPYRGM